MLTTDNYRKHTAKNPLQRMFINKFLDVLVSEARMLNPQSVLDVGCGEGFTLMRLHEEKIGKELTGVDYLETAIEIGKKLHKELRLQRGTIYHLPFKDNAFDLTLCTEVLEHLDNPGKALEELARVTKGSCIISVPHEPWFMVANFVRGKNLTRWGNDIEHINHWSRRGIVRLVNRYFDVRVVKNPFPWTLLVASKKR